MFATNKQKPIDYNGERTAAAITNYIGSQIQKLINKRLSGGSSSSCNIFLKLAGSSNEQKQNSSNSSEGQKKEKPKVYNDKDVIVLDDSNFESTLMNSQDLWLVEFYAPWCGHCKNLEPHWNQVASELKGKKIKIAKLDADSNKQTGSRFQISGFPTIKLFPPGKKSQSNTEPYDGPRDAAAIIAFAEERMEKFGIATSVDQIVSQKQLDDSCVERVAVCIIAFLPNIFDSTAAQRNAYIKELTEVK